MSWQETWELDPNAGTAAGGQGEVRKVARHADGCPGALKQLHEDHLKVTERRYRAKQEADALHVLDGHGTPKLLDGNTEHWKDKEVPLYVVVEWIAGQTLAKRVNGSPLPLDKALQIGQSLTEIVARCHELGIHHRDLKPDNVMLRGFQDEPILVDFGMSWTRPGEDDEPEFQTKEAQEIGNRFLRLPENAPGHHLHDARTDITYLRLDAR
jgi:serine/threonine protein kinase